MVFFDLSVPYLERDGAVTAQDDAAKKTARLKVVVKAMELGYTGIAYDRPIRGVMSDKDRCKIPPFPLSSLLKAAPSLAETVKFHRELLGVPLSTPFRQYTRLTVAVDNVVNANALNSGNPVLRTYDLVAVRPMNQVAFDQACKVSEVDLIAVDFSQKLPFRLKQPMVKAAIERGVYFEITYSHLISSASSRREMLTSAKLLVNWTHGKNLIFSSAAPTANEVRGPYDVANLSSLLGLSIERAKAAVSRNCRSLLARAIRKKQCYKETIRVEKISPGDQLKPNKDLLSDWNNWDPISSGDGDLPSLDEFAKFFSDAAKVPKSVPESCFSAEFVLVPGDMSHEDQNKRSLSSQNGKTPLFDAIQEPKPYSASNESLDHERHGHTLAAEQVPLPAIHLAGREDVPSFSGTSTSFSRHLEPGPDVTEQYDVTISNGADLACSIAMEPVRDESLKGEIPTSEVRPGFPDGKKIEPSIVYPEESKSSDADPVASVAVGTSANSGLPVDCTSCEKGHLVPPSGSETLYANFMDIDSSFVCDEDTKISTIKHDDASDSMPVVGALKLAEVLEKKDFVLGACSTSFQEYLAEDTQNDLGVDAAPVTEVMLVEEDFDEFKVQKQADLAPLAFDVSLKEGLAREQECSATGICVSSDKHKSGKGRFIQKLRHKALQFPSKGLLKPLLFKKKVHKLKLPRKHHVRINDGFSL